MSPLFGWRRQKLSPDAEDASREARRALRDAQNFDRRVEDVANQLDETRQRNHFAEAVAKAIRGV